MAVATLSIDLEARLARFEADMGRATRTLEQLGQSAAGTATRIGQIFAGNFVAAAAIEGVQRMIDLFPQLLDGVAKFQDLADETGASAEALARMQTAADVSGVSVENLAGLMVRLTGNLAKLSDEGKGAGQALANLGIGVEEFRRLSPDEQIGRLSAAFNSFADGSSKTSNALALFGRSGAQALKFFKEYGDGLESVGKLTAEQIRQADLFADASAKASSELRQAAQAIVVQSLPALTALKQGLKDGALAIFEFKGAGSALKADAALLDAFESAALAVGTVSEAIVGVVKLARAVAGSFQVVAADIALPFELASAAAGKLDGKTFAQVAENMRALLNNRNRVVAEANQRYVDLWTYNGTAVTDAIRKSFAAQRQLLTTPDALKDTRGGSADLRPALAPVAVKDEDAKRAEDAERRLLALINERRTVAEAELEVGQRLSESERFRIDIMAKLSEQEGKLSAAAVTRILLAAQGAAAAMKEREAQADLFKTRQAVQRLDDKAQAADQARLQALMNENEALQVNIEELGKSAEAVERLRLARLLQQRDDVRGDPAHSDREVALLERKIRLTQELIDKRATAARDALAGAGAALDEYLERVAKVGDATRNATGQSLQLLEDDLVTGLQRGQISVTRTVDFMIGEFLRLQVVRPLLANLFGNGAGAGFFAALFGSGGGAQVPLAMGGAFDGGAMVPFASGGVVDRPTLFRFGAGGAMTGLMGEAGPEGILPLKRGRDGRLGVSASGAGGGVVIHQTINVQSGASRNEVMQAAATAKQAAVAEIQDLIRRGRMQPA